MKRLRIQPHLLHPCLFGIMLLCVLPSHVMAQRYANYVLTEKRISANKTNISSYQFFDALGRPSLKAANNVGNDNRFVYLYNEIDGENQLASRWLPVVGDSEVLDMDIDLLEKNAAQYGEWPARESFGYDGMGRMIRQTKAGREWKNKPANITYVTNGRTDVKRYVTLSPIDNAPVENGYYDAGTLTGACVANEDGIKVTTYTNAFGKKVLERCGNDNDTYYVYDCYNRLRLVLMPKIQSEYDLDKYAFQYRYSLDGNLIYKKLPGCAPIEYVYDKNDRCLSVQDGELKKKGLYRFMLYDAVGRMVVQGLSTTKPDGAGEATVTLDENGGGMEQTGYRILNDASLNLTIKDIEVVNYYDNYRFATGSYAAHFSGLTKPSGDYARGRLSGSVVLASNGERLGSVMSYDQQGNVLEIQKRGLNGCMERVTNTYTYTNQLASSISVVKTQKGDTIKYEECNTYSPTTDRLAAVTRQAFSNNLPSRLNKCTYTYDRLGRLFTIDRPIDGGKGRLSYDYNIQSWTQRINSGSFNESIHYVDGQGKPMYSGNISSITWSDAGSGQTNRGYRYTYDDLNRLVNAEYGEDNFSTGIGRYNERLGYDGNSNVTSLQRKGVTQEGSYGLIDDLRLCYDGNQLSKVEENAPTVLYAGSLDVKRSTNDIRYNANGSLAMDGTRDITHIDYDLHNNPLRIQFANGNVTKYVYSAAGEKLRAIHYTAVANTHVEMGQVYADIEKRHLAVDSTDYRLGGNAVFNNGSFSKVLFDGGYVELVAVDMPGSGYHMPIVKPWKPPFGGRWPDDLGGGKKGPTIYSLRFRYFNRDHLGNVREVVSETGEVKQVNAYYPFGTPIHALGTNESQQRYKYNSKEFDELHGLNTYDYGARQYAPLLPLWDRVDPLAEKYYGVSPYVYCANNPVIFVDPDGRKFDFSKMTKGEYQSYLGQINPLREASPLFNTMYSSLENSKETYFISFDKVSSVVKQAGDIDGHFVKGDNGGGSVVFNKEKMGYIPSVVLAEELFHAYQHDNRNGYAQGEFNREFEAKTFATAFAFEVGKPFPTYYGMEGFLTRLKEGRLYGSSYEFLTPKDVRSKQFLFDYFFSAGFYSQYNNINGIGGSSYRERTAVIPYALQKIILDTYNK
ncbi:MAG: RHS repeat domain-containing protein [Prevotella sp.]